MARWRILVLVLALLLGAASVSVLWDALNHVFAGGVPTGNLPQTLLAIVALAAAIAVIARVVDAFDHATRREADPRRSASVGLEPQTTDPATTAGVARRER